MSQQYKKEWSGIPGYVNCLLVTMRRSNMESVSLNPSEQVPNLVELAEDNIDLKEWLIVQNFSFEQLNSTKVIDLLKRAAGIRWYCRKKTHGSIRTLDVGNKGKPVACIFELKVEKQPDGNDCVHLSLFNSENK